jgi:hypothetical protein
MKWGYDLMRFNAPNFHDQRSLHSGFIGGSDAEIDIKRSGSQPSQEGSARRPGQKMVKELKAWAD